ncbi:hypothetical protein P3H78_30780 [Streptomyces sp. K1PA1]|uniref:Uncharacterized protein n=1 Tax=Streptomyces tropicalis TaxID=3034234 RepID=A0ABT6AE57_9ACTN|nr:hypothetical protein [Streptomyces tropicalis]MDF3302919.1 hypothetical protein [Streptomyces tropicalis]
MGRSLSVCHPRYDVTAVQSAHRAETSPAAWSEDNTRGKTSTYSYDAANRLITAATNRGGKTYSHSYDDRRRGNRCESSLAEHRWGSICQSSNQT